MPRESKTSARRVQAIEREHQALQLRMQGHSYETIGRALKITGQGAKDAIKRAMKKATALVTESADEMRVFRTQQIERLLVKLEPGIQRGDVAAIREARANIHELIELWATAVPKQTVLTGPNGGPVEVAVGTWEDVVLMAQAARAAAEAEVGGGPVVDVTPEPAGLLTDGEETPVEGAAFEVGEGGDASGERG